MLRFGHDKDGAGAGGCGWLVFFPCWGRGSTIIFFFFFGDTTTSINEILGTVHTVYITRSGKG